MVLGDQNTAIYQKKIEGKPLTGYSNLIVREINSLPFIEGIPNKFDLSEDLHKRAQEVGSTPIQVLSTQQSEEFIEQTISGSVSVVVPTYNCQDYITETLQSIVNQDYKRLEILIVDDDSNDETVDRIKEFMVKHSNSVAIRFVKIPHMGNPGLSRNFALYNMLSESTEFISFMDGDDLFAITTALSALISELKKYPNAFAAYGGYDTISENGKQMIRPTMLKMKKSGKWSWKENCRLTWENMAMFNLEPYHLQCLIVRKGVPFIPYRTRGEDAEYYAKLFKMSSKIFNGELVGVIQVPVLCAHYRKRSGSISSIPLYDTGVDPSESERNKENSIPPFYGMAGIPDQYITSRNISKWAAKRWTRLLIRSLFSGQVKSALNFLKLAYKDTRVSRWDLISLAFKQLFLDSTMRDMAVFKIGHVLRNK